MARTRRRSNGRHPVRASVARTASPRAWFAEGYAVVERLRQESLAFDQVYKHGAEWFRLRVVMGYAAIFGLVGVAVVATMVILNSGQHPSAVVIGAAAALFTDVLGLFVGIWKIVLNDSVDQFVPITRGSRGRSGN
jgi:hypothetical protein